MSERVGSHSPRSWLSEAWSQFRLFSERLRTGKTSSWAWTQVQLLTEIKLGIPSGIWIRPNSALVSGCNGYSQPVWTLLAHALFIIIILTWSLSWLLHPCPTFRLSLLYLHTCVTSICTVMAYLRNQICACRLFLVVTISTILHIAALPAVSQWNLVATFMQLLFSRVNWCAPTCLLVIQSGQSELWKVQAGVATTRPLN